jgi:hypothetical protein
VSKLDARIESGVGGRAWNGEDDDNVEGQGGVMNDGSPAPIPAGNKDGGMSAAAVLP